MTTTNEHDFDFDLVITKTSRKAAGAGTWVSGTINEGFRFDALVFPEHADEADYEIGQSKISKLWVRGIKGNATLYGWDRGLDRPAATPEVQAMVDFLCDGLADATYPS